MTDAPEVLRYSAFAATPDGGNPAGVVFDADGLDEADMQRIAAEVGTPVYVYSAATLTRMLERAWRKALVMRLRNASSSASRLACTHSMPA